MTEDELLIGITDALTIAGWRWTHVRRSDQAVMMGHAGVPDIVAVHEGRRQMLAWELKSADGQPTFDQVAWIRGLAAVRAIDALVIRPAEYDQALAVILNAPDPTLCCVVCGRTADVRPLDPRSNAGLCADHELAVAQ